MCTSRIYGYLTIYNINIYGGFMADIIRLYHTGFAEIREPDIHYGRKNADFGQGFYMSDNEEFSKRWARVRRGENTILNTYDLDLASLKIHRFTRDAQWFAYIYANRNRRPDLLEADVITGPIANDTIYDTLGITTSGLLSEEQSLQCLLIGPEYYQIVIKSEKAVSQLKWISSEILTPEIIARYRAAVAEEEKIFQKKFAEVLSRI